MCRPVQAEFPAETDKGVGMYSRGSRDATPGRPLTRDELEQYARQLMGVAKNQPELVVVEKASDLPFDALDDAKGVLHLGKIFLVSESISDAVDASGAIFHEFVGDFGLRGFFGDRFNTALDLIHVNNPLVRQYTNEWMEHNRDFQKRYDIKDLDYVGSSGATFMNLAGHIDAGGGKILGLQAFGSAYEPLDNVLEKLQDAYTWKLQDVIRQLFGGKINERQLTNPEAGALVSHAKGILERGGTRGAGSQDGSVRGKYAQAIPEHQVRVGSPERTRLTEDNLNALVQDLTRTVKGITLEERDGAIWIKTKSGQDVRIEAVEQINPDAIAVQVPADQGSIAKARRAATTYIGREITHEPTVPVTLRPQELARSIRHRSDIVGEMMNNRGMISDKQLAAQKGNYIHYAYHVMGDDAPIGISP